MPGTRQTLSGASWLYPLKGIFYFINHRFLWRFFRARLLPIALLSAFIYTNLFLWTYLPQVAFLLIFHGSAAWFNGVILVLGEGQIIIALLFEAFLVDETLVDIFDTVLVNEGFHDLVGSARILLPTPDSPAKALGKPTKSAVYSPFSLRQIIEFAIFLPINLVPYVGVPVFLLITGYRAGPFHHWRYFQLREMSKKARKQYIRDRQLKYTWFGTAALCLQLVPVLSMLFLLTTAAGSALWVVRMERARLAREQNESSHGTFQDEPS